MGIKVKSGMGGSRNGKSRREPTAVLKNVSKARRRAEGKKECRVPAAMARLGW